MHFVRCMSLLQTGTTVQENDSVELFYLLGKHTSPISFGNLSKKLWEADPGAMPE